MYSRINLICIGSKYIIFLWLRHETMSQQLQSLYIAAISYTAGYTTVNKQQET